MEPSAIADVVQQIEGWPAPMRISLARQILESVERHAKQEIEEQIPCGPSAADVAARFRTGKAAPDDQTVKQWIDEHRDAKYGS